jgi:hypothetical protein
MKNILAVIALSVIGSTGSAQQSHEGHGVADPSMPVLGAIDFPTTASDKSHAAFVRGVLLLHNYHYGEAARFFRDAQHLDSTNVMGYWGEAMTYTHPVWNAQDTAEAHKVLARLAPSRDARRALARSARERQWLDAVETLYESGSTKAHRDTAYSAAMAAVHMADTADVEATTFYALSLLGLNQGDREPVAYGKAYELVAPVFLAHPHHPGAAHYLIHAVDDPDHAALGLKAASAYSDIAPSAGHALHMTSHIFLALGKWDDVVDANIRAMATLPKGVINGHSSHWLHYALVQQGRYHEADRWLDSMVKQTKAGPDWRRADSWDAAGLMAAANVADTRRWNGLAASVRIDKTAFKCADCPDAGPDIASAEFGYGLAALNRGDRRTFDEVVAGMDSAIRSAGDDPTKHTVRGMTEVMQKTLRGYAAWKGSRSADALALFRDAAVEEAALPMPFGRRSRSSRPAKQQASCFSK